jgi:hypothetical protein
MCLLIHVSYGLTVRQNYGWAVEDTAAGRRVSEYGAPKTYDQPADNASLCVFAPDLLRLMSRSVRHRRVKTLLLFAFRSFLVDPWII